MPARCLLQRCPRWLPPQLVQDWRTFRARLVAMESGQAARAARLQLGREERWAHVLAQPERGCLLVARRPGLGMFANTGGGPGLRVGRRRWRWFGCGYTYDGGHSRLFPPPPSPCPPTPTHPLPPAVILVLEHDDGEGSSGLVINMPTPLMISHLGLEEDIAGVGREGSIDRGARRLVSVC